MWLSRESPLVVLVLGPGQSRSLGTGFLVLCDTLFSPLGFLLLNPLGNLFKVLLVTQCVPAKTLSLLLSPAGQVFSFLIVPGGEVAGSIEPGPRLA